MDPDKMPAFLLYDGASVLFFPLNTLSNLGLKQVISLQPQKVLPVFKKVNKTTTENYRL